MSYVTFYWAALIFVSLVVICITFEMLFIGRKKYSTTEYLAVILFGVFVLIPHPNQPRQSYIDSLWLQHIPVKDWK